MILGSIFTDHYREYSPSFSPRFFKLKSINFDWLNCMPQLIRSCYFQMSQNIEKSGERNEESF